MGHVGGALVCSLLMVGRVGGALVLLPTSAYMYASVLPRIFKGVVGEWGRHEGKAVGEMKKGRKERKKSSRKGKKKENKENGMGRE